MQRPEAEPAPARGCYDRALSRQARQAEQRERLVYWIAQKHQECGTRLTVQDVVAAAGVGRNTFYEYFDGLEHGLAYAAQTCAKLGRERIMSELESARTPIAKLRKLARAWLEFAESEPAALLLLARRPANASGSDATALFQSLLQQVLNAGSQALALPSDRVLEACAASAAEGASLRLLAGEATRLELQAALELVLTRVFR